MKKKSKIIFFYIHAHEVKIMLGRRKMDSNFFWWLPGGTIESNENLLEAAIREVYEELIPGPVIKNVLFNLQKQNKTLPTLEYEADNAINTIVFIQLPTEEIPEIKDEFDKIQWFELSQMPEKMSRQFKHIKEFITNEFFIKISCDYKMEKYF